MSNGWHRMVINTQERAVSTDINRLQAFMTKDIAEIWRYMLDCYGNDDLDAGAVVVEPNTIENPLRAEIINGLLCRPQQGSLNIVVDPGVVFVMAPDAAADESNYKYIEDVGVAAGALVMTANASGSTRIDVIECQINPTDKIVTDNRDIFNPVTGLFTPTAVTKERSGQLSYRVRAGTPGAGWPGTALGWLPLCVASVPNGTTAVDTVTFWDVRPLINDRTYQPFALTNDLPRVRRALVSGPGNVMTGIVETEFAGRRLGGRLRSGTPTSDAQSIDATAAANQEPGIVFTASRPWYLYYLTPFGLPRWARYTNAAPRLPRSPRGLPVVSMTPPLPSGEPSAAINLPTATGFTGGSAAAGVVALAGANNGAAAQKTVSGNLQEGYRLEAPIAFTGAVNGNGGRYDLVAGTHYPANAKALLVEVAFDGTVTPANMYNFPLRVAVSQPGVVATVLQDYVDRSINLRVNNNDVVNVKEALWIDLPPTYPTNTTGYTQRIDVYLDTGILLLPAGATLRVLGWKL